MHIIQRNTVSFNVTSGRDMKSLQEELSTFCAGPLMERLEKTLDKISFARDLKIERLELEFDLNNPEDFEQKLLALIEQNLISEIAQNLPATLPEGVVNEKLTDQFQAIKPVELLTHFLRYGSLPWWSKTESLETLLSRVAEESTSTQTAEVFLFLVSNEAALTRLIYQWQPVESLTFILGLISSSMAIAIEISLKTNPEKEVLLTALSQSFKSLSQSPKIHEFGIFRSIIHSLISRKILPAPEAEQLISSFDNTPLEDKPLPPKSAEPESTPPPSDEEEWYVENAGLILLNPFIRGFLQEYEACDAEQIIDPNLALYLLQYLATGKEEAWESELVLNKILCGLPLDFVVKPPVKLPENLKAESEKLITACIKYWPVMQGTSVEGFREAFLKRGGKISQQFVGYQLTVELKPYDMLLAEVPWNINIVGFNWMQKPLKINWTH